MAPRKDCPCTRSVPGTGPWRQRRVQPRETLQSQADRQASPRLVLRTGDAGVPCGPPVRGAGGPRPWWGQCGCSWEGAAGAARSQLGVQLLGEERSHREPKPSRVQPSLVPFPSRDLPPFVYVSSTSNGVLGLWQGHRPDAFYLLTSRSGAGGF